MSNRAAKYELLYKSLKKNFKPLPEIGERSVLEHLIYSCCLEDARADQADEAFAKLQQAYFDWNEVRVTTVIELGEALSSLPNATHAGHRIKRCLQSLFESRYQYDVEDMKKANLGKATEELMAWKGVSPFILNYVSQNALGGHAIPVDSTTLEVLVQADIITTAEAEKKTLPGIERAIPKNKGLEFASLLHQFAIEFHHNPKSVAALAVFKELGVSPKSKAIEKPEPVKPSKAAKSVAPPAQEQPKAKAPSGSAKTVEVSDKPVANPPAATTGKGKEAAANKVTAKTETTKPESTKKPESKAVEKPESKKAPDKKPAAKAAEKGAVDAKPVAKKAESKPVAKKPTETKKTTPPPKTKSAPPKEAAPKASPAKSNSKSGSAKPVANQKVTKKKPR